VSRRLLTLLLLASVALAFLLSLRIGHVSLTNAQALDALLGKGELAYQQILREIRLPRALLAILVGGGLALSGSVFQARTDASMFECFSWPGWWWAPSSRR